MGAYLIAWQTADAEWMNNMKAMNNFTFSETFGEMYCHWGNWLCHIEMTSDTRSWRWAPWVIASSCHHSLAQIVSQLLNWAQSLLSDGPRKKLSHLCLPVQGLLNWKWPPTQNIYPRGGTGRRGTKITPVIFSHVGVFWILIVWVLKSHSSFKTLPFHLGAAHRLLLIYDLWTNTSFQMHWQEEQAVQVLFCCLIFLFLGAMYPPILTAYWRYIFCSDWVLKQAAMAWNVFLCLCSWQTAPKCSSKESI